MRVEIAFAAMLPLFAVAAAHAQDRARYNWIMHCQGCHGTEGQGSPNGSPPLADNVAKFLHSEEGRDYLVRVPGVAFVGLSDAQVAELLNWTVRRFDVAHVPQQFTPYSENEVKRLRERPLISQAFSTRQRILRSLQAKGR